MMQTRRNVIASALGASVVGGTAGRAVAAPRALTENGLALGGYDCVAYWTAKKATRGQPSWTFEWSGVNWAFASQANRDAFVAGPERYAPAFNGYCVY